MTLLKIGGCGLNKAGAFSDFSFEPSGGLTMRTKRAAIYLRVSTTDQNTDNEEHELRQVAERAGWEVVKVYRDLGISSAKGRDKRPQFDALCHDATKRQFDIVLAWSVDRLGRSLQDLVGFQGEIHSLKIDLRLHQQGIDTTTPAGKALFNMMGVFAEFERSMFQERVRAGLERARREGKRLGRPPIASTLRERIQEALRAPGRPGVRKIAIQFGVNVSTVQRISSRLQSSAPAIPQFGQTIRGPKDGTGTSSGQGITLNNAGVVAPPTGHHQ
jgi:DNA invertase Pin-like site-specific DNA recombinase